MVSQRSAISYGSGMHQRSGMDQRSGTIDSGVSTVVVRYFQFGSGGFGGLLSLTPLTLSAGHGVTKSVNASGSGNLGLERLDFNFDLFRDIFVLDRSRQSISHRSSMMVSIREAVVVEGQGSGKDSLGGLGGHLLIGKN